VGHSIAAASKEIELKNVLPMAQPKPIQIESASPSVE
jgi:hypothetical protein